MTRGLAKPEGDVLSIDALPANVRTEIVGLEGEIRANPFDTQALVHESFMRFVTADKIGIDDRKHFFTYAAKTMRNIVIDFARRRQADRHGGAAERVTLDSRLLGQGQQDTSVIDVDNALRELEALDPALAQVVEMRYFGGYTDAEIATAMDIADRTVRRHWDKARAFILAQLEP